MRSIIVTREGAIWDLPPLANRQAEAPVPRPGASGWLLVDLASLGAISALWSYDWVSSLISSSVLFGGLFYLEVGRTVGRSGVSIRNALLLVVADVGVLLSVLSLIAYVLHIPLLTQASLGESLLSGTFGYANAMAGFLMMTIACTVALFLSRRICGSTAAPGGRGGWSTALFAGSLCVQLTALALTSSRAAWALTACGSLFCVFALVGRRLASPRFRRLLVIATLAVALVGFIGSFLYVWHEVAPQMAASGPPATTTYAQGEGADAGSKPSSMTADAYRIKTWRAALQALGASPIIGHGLDAFYYAYAPYKAGSLTTHAHNLVVQHLVELGVVGTVLLLCLLGALLMPSTRLLRSSPGDPLVPLALAAWAFVLHNLVDLTWYFPALFYLFLVLCGMLESAQRER